MGELKLQLALLGDNLKDIEQWSVENDDELNEAIAELRKVYDKINKQVEHEQLFDMLPDLSQEYL